MLQQVVPLYSYFPNPSKSYLVVNGQYFQNAIEIFKGSEVKITKEVKKYLRAAIESEDFAVSYVNSLVDN